MSRLTPTTLEALALEYRCSYCQSIPKQWCRTSTKRWTTCLHAPRYEPVQCAFAAGYDEYENWLLTTTTYWFDEVIAGLRREREEKAT